MLFFLQIIIQTTWGEEIASPLLWSSLLKDSSSLYDVDQILHFLRLIEPICHTESVGNLQHIFMQLRQSFYANKYMFFIQRGSSPPILGIWCILYISGKSCGGNPPLFYSCVASCSNNFWTAENKKLPWKAFKCSHSEVYMHCLQTQLHCLMTPSLTTSRTAEKTSNVPILRYFECWAPLRKVHSRRWQEGIVPLSSQRIKSPVTTLSQTTSTKILWR